MSKFPPGARENSDGSISFPCKGAPPVCNIEGYEVSSGDAYLWIRKWVPCKLRLLAQAYICPSGKTKTRNMCMELKLQINPKYCAECCPVPAEKKM